MRRCRYQQRRSHWRIYSYHHCWRRATSSRKKVLRDCWRCATSSGKKVLRGKYINGHVILNQCGSLLSRQAHTIKGYRHQKHFLQRIASTSFDTSIPLLYLEGMLFPSFFCKQMLHDESIIRATPSSLLS